MRTTAVTMMFTLISFAGCKTRRTDPMELAAQPVLFTASDSLNITARIHQEMPFRPKGSYVAMNIDPTTIEPIKEELQRRYNTVLKSRGESHITLITPPEMKVLRTRLTAKEINDIVKPKIQSSKFDVVCIGNGEITQGQKTLLTYFLVVRSEDLMNLRIEILKAFQNKGGQPDEFSVAQYYPHITIGFTDRDLHEADGIIKDARSCVIPTSVL